MRFDAGAFDPDAFDLNNFGEFLSIKLNFLTGANQSAAFV